MGAAIAWLVAKIFGDNLLRHVAMKALLLAFMTVVLPVVLNNFIVDIMTILFDFIASKIANTGLGNTTLSVSSLAAYIFVKFKIVECFSLIMGAVAFRTSLNMIPFLRV